MTSLWWLSPVGRLEPLAVVRETPKRIYYRSPLNGSERFVLRARMLDGWAWVAALRSALYDELGRRVFLASSPRDLRALSAFGLDSSATADDVRRAFRERAKTAHPDAEHGSHDAFVALQRTYERALEAVRGAQ